MLAGGPNADCLMALPGQTQKRCEFAGDEFTGTHSLMALPGPRRRAPPSPPAAPRASAERRRPLPRGGAAQKVGAASCEGSISGLNRGRHLRRAATGAQRGTRPRRREKLRRCMASVDTRVHTTASHRHATTACTYVSMYVCIYVRMYQCTYVSRASVDTYVHAAASHRSAPRADADAAPPPPSSLPDTHASAARGCIWSIIWSSISHHVSYHIVFHNVILH